MQTIEQSKLIEVDTVNTQLLCFPGDSGGHAVIAVVK